MADIVSQEWFWPAVIVSVGLPLMLIALTEIHNAMARRNSRAAPIVLMVRNYLVPLAGILVLISQPGAWQGTGTWPRVVWTIFGLLCTAAAFVVFGRLIAEIGPGRALVITYVNPVVALALGMAVLGERPGPGAIAGLLLILAGSWLSTDGRLPPGLMGVLSRVPRTRRRSPAPSDSRVSRGSPPSPDPSPAGSS